jgi:hypothetical protein
MSIEAMRQARNAFVWNLNTDLDNIPACDKWAKMLRKNIDALDKAIAESEKQQRTWVGLTDKEIAQGMKGSWVTKEIFKSAVWWAEAKLKDKNT